MSRFATSRKKETVINQLYESNEKRSDKKGIKIFFEEARMCETKQAILTTSSIEQ